MVFEAHREQIKVVKVRTNKLSQCVSRDHRGHFTIEFSAGILTPEKHPRGLVDPALRCESIQVTIRLAEWNLQVTAQHVKRAEYLRSAQSLDSNPHVWSKSRI